MSIPEHIATRLNALRGALQDPDADVRANASRSLEKLEAIANIDHLIERFKNGEHVEKIRVIYAFGKLKSEIAMKALVYALRSENEEIRTASIRALGEMADNRALGPILEALQAGDETTQREILSILPQFNDDRIFPAVKGALKSKSIAVVDAAIQALGEIGNPDAEAPLLMVLQKGTPPLRRSAAAAIGKLST